ncbi:hypothetical protein E4U41_004878 [Claviceps citrina]|nr:hypothetical protein E4U41_004878 [Claviceps citrina]
MHAKSLVLASALAMATSVVAERPRIYFPREMKREYTNTTITKPAASASSTGPTTTKFPSTTRRDLLSDLVSEILGSHTATYQTASTTHAHKSIEPPSNSVTSGSGLPKITVTPTPKQSEPNAHASTSKKNPLTDPAIVIGPTGIVSSSNEASTSKRQPATEGSKAKPTLGDAPPAVNTTTFAKGTSTTTGKNSGQPVITLSSSLSPEHTSAASNTKAPLEAPASHNTTSPFTSNGASASRISSSATLTPSTTSHLPTNTPSGHLPSLSLLPHIGGSTSANSTTEPTTVPAIAETSTKLHSGHHHSSTSLLPTGGSSTTNAMQSLANNTTTDVSMTGTASGSITPTSSPKTTTDHPMTNETSTIPPTRAPTNSQTTGPVTIPTTGTDHPMTNETSTIPPKKAPTNSQTTGPVTIPTTGTDVATTIGTQTTGLVTNATSATGVAMNNGTATIPTTSQITLPSSSAFNTNSTRVLVPIRTALTSSSTASRPTVTRPTSTATASAAPQATHLATTRTESAVTSIRPTATVSDTDWLPNTIVVEPTTFTLSAPRSTRTGTMSQALPTTIPKFIFPDDPNKAAPEGTVPIHIGFTFPLNYVFVSSNTVAAAQIFKFLPVALADASGVSVDLLQISKLVPYNTQNTWGYVTTLAQLNYPATLVDTLQMDLWSPNSAIYNNRDAIVRNLTALINPNIDIRGNINDGGLTGGGGINDGGNHGNSNDAFGSGNGGNQSSKQKATTAGIAIAALGFSAMYGVAMFIVARRYKRKRQSHRRSSSITSSPASSEMQYNAHGSPALMGGALMSPGASTSYGAAGARDSQGSGGHSARTANISAPVATENSLGWN